MPIPNIYLTHEEVTRYGQISFQLDAHLCEDCGLVQLGQIIPAKALFPSEYAYKTPEAMRSNFRENARETILIAKAKAKSKVLEIGSNIGICLQEYKKKGLEVLGVDPATIYAKEARKNGIETIASPFTVRLAEKIVKEKDKMDIVTAANVLQHIPDLKGTLEGIKKVLAPDGIFVLEFPYLGNILENTDFDTFYAEHYYYLSLTPLQKLLNNLGMTIVHAKKLPNIHCGSMRIFVKHQPAKTSRSAQIILKQEEKLEFKNPKRYDEFAKKVDDVIYEILVHLNVAKRKGEYIAAHGSSAKFVTLTNYAHIGPDRIAYVGDSTETKQGKLTPGMGIPVFPEEKLLADAPDIVFSGIRNFFPQNLDKYKMMRKKNPKLRVLIPIPQVIYR